VASEEANAELTDLRQRLAEAEEALRAIYQGEVDALVCAGRTDHRSSRCAARRSHTGSWSSTCMKAR
jgi:hypothetical protein